MFLLIIYEYPKHRQYQYCQNLLRNHTYIHIVRGFFTVLTEKYFEILPKNDGCVFISEPFALNW